MEINFQIDELAARFIRNWFTGSATLFVGGQPIQLENPLDPSTHINLSFTKVWNVNVRNHTIGLEMTRSRFFGGMRPMSYRVFMDGQLIVEKVGY